MQRVIAYLLLFIAVAFIGCATAPIEERSYQKVVQIDTMKKNAIYDKTLQWAALGFKSSKAVLQYQDKEEGKIIGQYVVQHNVLLQSCTIDCTMQIDIKDYKVRLSFNSSAEQTCYGSRGSSSVIGVDSSSAEDVVRSFRELTNSYQSFMLKTSNPKSEDW